MLAALPVKAASVTMDQRVRLLASVACDDTRRGCIVDCPKVHAANPNEKILMFYRIHLVPGGPPIIEDTLHGRLSPKSPAYADALDYILSCALKIR